MGQWLRALGARPDQVMTSSALRAKDTAERVVLELGYEGPLIVSPRLYMADVPGILAVVGEADPAAETVLILGHNPGISETASLLSGVELDMPTAGVAWIELDLPSFQDIQVKTRGRLVRWHRPPKEDKSHKGAKKAKS
jgi:phosphohistidine phosphatase